MRADGDGDTDAGSCRDMTSPIWWVASILPLSRSPRELSTEYEDGPHDADGPYRLTGGQLDYDSPFGQTGTTSNWTPSATRSSRSTRRHARIELDDGPISLRAPQESALELARQREFEANGIDDQSLDFLTVPVGARQRRIA